MENLILPPKVLGEVSAFLQVGCDFIKFNTKCISGATGVYLLWWGQDTTQQVCLSPPVLPPKYSDIGSNDFKHKGIRTSVYHITAEEDQFKNYLCDSDYLFLQIRDVDDNPIGFSAVEKLFRVIDFGGLRDDVPIYDCTEHQKNKIPEVIGHMRIWMTYDVRNKIDCNYRDEPLIKQNIEASANMQLQDSNTSHNDINSVQTIPVSSNKDSKNHTKKQITKMNRSSPVLIISKKKTPLRNSNYSRRARKSDGIIRPNLHAAETPCLKDLPVGMHGDHNDANKVTVKKNVTFFDQNHMLSPEYELSNDEVVVNEHNLSQLDTMHNYNCSKEFSKDPKNGAHAGDKDITELRRLIDRSNERIAESELASSKNWRHRERLLIEKAYLHNDAAKELENKQNMTSNNMIDNSLLPANLRQYDFYEDKENNCPSRINSKSPTQNVENHLISDEKNNSETSQVDAKYQRPVSLPSWNLSTERLKYLGQVNHLIVNVKSVFFKPETYSQIKELWTQNISGKTRESIKYASKGLSTLQSNERSTLNSKPKNPPKRTLCSKAHAATLPTFFIAYSIPPERQDTHICSKRGVGAEKKTAEPSSELKFNSSVNHPIRFDTQVLDKWWMSTVEFKVYSRSLNQRVPTFIGSASIKLKHLLMNEKYTYDQAQSDKLSNHAGLKLTIFASSSLKQALKNMGPSIFTNSALTQSEILGEISINFAFAKESKKHHISDQSPQHDENSSQNFKIQPGEKELVPSNANDKKISYARNDDIIVFEANENENTRASMVTGAEETNLFRERHNMARIKTNEDPTIQIQSNSSGRKQHLTIENSSLATEKSTLSDSESLVGLLRVPEGKNYILPHEDTNSVHVACRIFSSGTYIRSKNCEYSSRPGGGVANLSLQHAVSFLPRPKFISDVCKENYLIIESWGTRSNAQEIKSDLIGISSISLHKIYTSFQEHHQINRTRDLELPVMISNGWIAVNNLLDGRYVGHLRVLFAVGFYSQINNLCRILKINFPSQVERLNDFKISDSIRLQDVSEKVNEKENETNLRLNESKKAIEHRDSCDQIKNQMQNSNESPKNQQVLHEVDIPIEKRDNLKTRFESIRLIVLVEEGRNLPIITENRLDKKEIMAKKSSDAMGVRSVLPNTYVSLPRAYNDNFLVDGDPVKAMNAMSSIMPNTSSPRWNMQTFINCPTELLTDSKRQLIIKVWHRPHFDLSDSQSFSDEAACGIDDYVLGFAAIDVSPLLREGYTSCTDQICDDNESNHIKTAGLCGWYNLMDFVGRRKGQIKVNIQVDMDSNETRKEFARLKSLKVYTKDKLTANLTLHGTDITPNKMDGNSVQGKNTHRFSSKNVYQTTDTSSQILNEGSEIRLRPNHFHNDSISLSSTAGDAQNRCKNKLETSDERRTSHWKIPTIPDTNLEATHSVLHAKMSDLDELAMQLKAKLMTACNKSYSSTPKKVDNPGRLKMNESEENISLPAKQFKDHEKQSLSELRMSITKQLSLMQEQLQTKAQSINSENIESVSKAQKQNEINPANSISKSPYQPLTHILESSDCTSMSRESPTSSITIASGDSQMIEHSSNNLQLDITTADNLEKHSVVQGAQDQLILTKEHSNMNEDRTDDVTVINENTAKSNLTNKYFQDNMISPNKHTGNHPLRSLPVYTDSIHAMQSEEPIDIESTRRVEKADFNALQCSLLDIDSNDIERERRSRMEPDGARNPSPYKNMNTKP